MNPIDAEIHRHRFQSIAEEMGVVLRNTSISPNIKERLDFSCAISGDDGAMVAQAAHIPVHLGACHLVAREILSTLELEPGDVVVVNDPFRGGTHLPDVTLFAPVFDARGERVLFGALSRAHHADVGGGAPGSMGDFDEIFKEGLIIPPVRIERRGERVADVEAMFLANVRTPDERRGDLTAQIAATRLGRARLEEAMAREGEDVLRRAGTATMDRAARAIEDLVATLPDGRYEFEDRLDGEGSPLIRVAVDVRGRHMTVDFSGTDPTVPASVNAHEGITLACVFYVVRCLAPRDVPTNSGVLRPIEVVIPVDTVVGARHPAAVASGNVETSQRIVDVLLGALAPALPELIPAFSQGSMNNVALGGARSDGSPFTYFETIGGGAGAAPTGSGASGIHSHMTNTLNTPIEALENELPVRVREYTLRSKSGGEGRHRGGDGIVREMEMLTPVTVSWSTTRRSVGPSGMSGGGTGAPGRNIIIRGGKRRVVAARGTESLAAGDRLRLETPGGGGWGKGETR